MTVEETARRHHRNLLDATMTLEAALASPVEDFSGWLGRVKNELEDVEKALDGQRQEYEGPDGVFQRVVAQAPRLQHAIDKMRSEQGRIQEDLDDALSTIGSATDQGSQVVGKIRDDCMDVFATVLRLRHESSDLMWEALDVDIGGGD